MSWYTGVTTEIISSVLFMGIKKKKKLKQIDNFQCFKVNIFAQEKWHSIKQNCKVLSEVAS